MRSTRLCGKVIGLSLAGIGLVALLCPATRQVLGQTSDSPKRSRDSWEARGFPGENIFYSSVLDRDVSFSLELGQPQRRVLLESGRAATVSHRTGLPSRSTNGSELSDPAPAAITNNTFTNGAGTGLWSNAGNWSAGPPTSTSNVLITGTGKASAVTEDILSTINNMNLKSSNSWTLNNNLALTIDGNSISNAGTMTLNSTGGVAELVIGSSAVTLGGGGKLNMSNSANNFVFGNATGDTLVNQETIQGAGNIGDDRMTLVNSGTINANQSVGLTIEANGGTTNTGTLEATGGPLTLYVTTVNNTGGTILDNGETLTVTSSTINGGTVTLTGASTLELSNSTIENGTLNNSAKGTIEAVSGTTNTLASTINNPTGGVIAVQNGAQLYLQNGNYSSLGAVTVNSTGSGTYLRPYGGNVTLSGGSVTLSNNAANYIEGSAVTDTLTNQETIQGAGTIGNYYLTLVNSGTINANQSAGLTIYTAGGTSNTGTIEATAGPLTVYGTTVNNTGGKISDNGQTLTVTSSTINGGTVTLTGTSSLQLSNSTIQGGTLTNSSTGTIVALSSTTNVLGGTITNPTGGVVQINNGAVLKLQSGSYANAGSLTINSTGSATELVVNGSNVTLTGGGMLTMSNNAENFILGATSTNILTNQETIQGTGNIGNNSMGLVNSGTLIANQGTPLIIQPNFMGFSNNGTLLVSSGDVMHVETGPFLNFVGGTLSGGTYNVRGTLEIDQLGSTGGEIVTNAANIILNGTSSSIIDGGAKNALSNLATNATGSSFTITGGQNFTTVGSFTNNGTLAVGSGSTFKTSGALTNLSGTTLPGGTYNVTGTLQYQSTSDISTNAANITLTGSTGKIIDQNSKNALASLTSNSSTGSLTLTAGQFLSDTATALTNAGSLTVGKTSQLTLSPATGTYTQTAGTTTVDGTLTAKGGIIFSGGSVFGDGGTLAGNTKNSTSSGAFNVGDAIKTAGLESITGTYTQSSTGILDMDVGGTAAGTQFDHLTISAAASLNGTLNLDLINGFVPTIGETFDILNASSVGGTFATVNGLPISGTEHFTVVYNPTNVTLDVVSGAAAHRGSGTNTLGHLAGPTSATPEPSTLLLLGSGLLLAAHYARRRASKGRRSSKD